MTKTKKERIRRWAYAGGWTLLIYSTLYVVRFISDALKEFLPYSLIMNVLMILVLCTILIYALTVIKIRRISSFVLMVMTLCCYVIGLVIIEIPDEKVHFLEYGILAYLIFNALNYDYSRLVSYAGALLLTSLLGWGDEMIQGILPNRYYCLRDILLNSISGALALLLTFIIERERESIKIR